MGSEKEGGMKWWERLGKKMRGWMVKAEAAGAVASTAPTGGKGGEMERGETPRIVVPKIGGGLRWAHETRAACRGMKLGRALPKGRLREADEAARKVLREIGGRSR